MMATPPTRGRTSALSPYTRTAILDVIAASGRRQSWVAAQMGISEHHLSRVGHGRLPISSAFVEAACRVLQLPPSALFFTDAPAAAPATTERSA
jgi:hypothetical protein